MLHGMQTWFYMRGADSYAASRKALSALYGLVQQQAAMLSFVESFWLMGILFLAMLPFVALLRTAKCTDSNPGQPATRDVPQTVSPALPVEEEEPVLVTLAGRTRRPQPVLGVCDSRVELECRLQLK
jgi:hypothetical protein